MARKGLGKGLDSLIPNIYDENFDSNSTQSLEDMLKEDESVEEVIEDIESKEEESNSEETSKDVEDEEDGSKDIETTDKDDKIPQGVEVDDGSSENVSGSESSEESVQTSPEVQVQQEHIDEVLAIVDKNPRITLWSSRSSAVFRYLRKTEPEFSISKEASILIEEAVAKKYPEIWALFEDL